MNYTNKNPWLWAVYVIVVGLPLVLIFTFCCNSQVFIALNSVYFAIEQTIKRENWNMATQGNSPLLQTVLSSSRFISFQISKPKI